MTASAFDIAILGAGPVGRVLALMLARVAPDPARIALLQGTAPLHGGRRARGRSSRAGHEPRQPRAARIAGRLAGTLGRHPQHPCLAARRLGRSLIRHTDFDVPQLGSVVGYSGLYARLEARVAQCGVTLLSGPPARILEQDADGVRVAQGDTELRCRVVVQSDGAGGEDLRRDYGQHAVLTTAHAALPPRLGLGALHVRGPLALLPHPHTPEAHSVVWCSTPQRAAELVALDNAAFSRALSAFGDRLGRLSSQAPRHVFPLALSARRARCKGAWRPSAMPPRPCTRWRARA